VCNILPEVYMNGSDVGENSIISNILSLNFDSDDSVLNSPHNLANLLLVETDKCNGLSKEISSSWKSQNSKQSRFLFARSEGSIERSSHYSTPNLASSRQLQREWENGQDVLESTNGHELLNINGLSNNASGPKVQGFQSTSEGSTFLVPSEAKGEFCLLLLLDISNFLLIIVFYLLLIWHLQLLFPFIQPF